jgi:hypothetical protein
MPLDPTHVRCPLFLPLQTVNCFETLKLGKERRHICGRCPFSRCPVFPFSGRNSHLRMPSAPMHLLCLKRCHACDQRHSSRVATFLPVHAVNSVQTLKAQTKYHPPRHVCNDDCGTVLVFRQNFTLEDAIGSPRLLA